MVCGLQVLSFDVRFHLSSLDVKIGIPASIVYHGDLGDHSTFSESGCRPLSSAKKWDH